MRLFDAHCHLDFMSNMGDVARDAEADGLHVLATTVTPRGYLRARDALAGLPNVSVAVGAHPWWVADGRLSPADVRAAADLAGTARYVGEVGMDFSPRHVPEGSQDVQRAALRLVCEAAASGSDPAHPTVISIHSVRSAGEVLGILRQTGCLERCRCVFHWFSGSSDELHAAVVAGCWFSVNPMMLRTRRGREYARQVPLDHLLTETDLPPGEDVPFSAAQIEGALRECLAGIAEARTCDADVLACTVCDNAERLLA